MTKAENVRLQHRIDMAELDGKAGFNPNQLRDPGGEGGGQWISTHMGFKISGEQVYEVLERGARGRPLKLGPYLGRVWREGRKWRNDQSSDEYPTQEEAGRALQRIVSRRKPLGHDR